MANQKKLSETTFTLASLCMRNMRIPKVLESELLALAHIHQVSKSTIVRHLLARGIDEYRLKATSDASHTMLPEMHTWLDLEAKEKEARRIAAEHARNEIGEPHPGEQRIDLRLKKVS